MIFTVQSRNDSKVILRVFFFSCERAIDALEDYGILTNGQQAILTPLSGLHPSLVPIGISLQRAIDVLEDHGILTYGQQAILTPLSGLHPTIANANCVLSINYHNLYTTDVT